MNTVLFVRKRKKIFAIVLLILFLVNLVIPYSIAFADLQHKQVLPQETPEHQQVTPQEVPEHQQVEPEKKNTQVQETEKKETPFWENVINFPDTSEYKALKAIFNDFYIAKIATAEAIINEFNKVYEENTPVSKWSVGSTAYTGVAAIARGFLGINVQGTGWAQKSLDIWDAVDKSVLFSSHVDWKKVGEYGSRLFGRGSLSGSGRISFSQLAASPGSISGLGKFAGWVGVGLSTYESIAGFSQAFAAEDGSQQQADGVFKGLAGAGGALMGAAPLLVAATAMAPPAGLIMAGIGLGFWGVGTVGKYFSKNKSVRNFFTAPVRGIKKLFS
ncbi:hypothetical protein [Thermoactinomyces mirandus]|uniref:Uncharacterized protein n=1 Tax=Thermoactinomyces mirandus TaxID=2756294 RepID=A0A7W1XVE5_9BACL|nr:hypothetical protein [Thermoactinomyces mirandus]MBA4603913.1 hypothetical protein [Thermoactinomyces mirandus]